MNHRHRTQANDDNVHVCLKEICIEWERETFFWDEVMKTREERIQDARHKARQENTRHIRSVWYRIRIGIFPSWYFLMNRIWIGIWNWNVEIHTTPLSSPSQPLTFALNRTRTLTHLTTKNNSSDGTDRQNRKKKQWRSSSSSSSMQTADAYNKFYTTICDIRNSGNSISISNNNRRRCLLLLPV